MPPQLELFSAMPETLTVSTGFEYLWRYHIQFKPCGPQFMGNRKAICKTIGHIPMKDLTRPQILALHYNVRASAVGPQALKHDLKLISLLYNKIREWIEDGLVDDGVDFSKFSLPPINPTQRIKRPKTYPREVIWTKDEFSMFCEHAPQRLLERAYFAIDTAQSECDLKSLKVSQYDQRRDAITFTRRKTGKRETIPITDRCRAIILQRIKEGAALVLDWTNHRKEFEETRKKAGLKNRQWRDIRKTSINRVRSIAGRIGPAQKIAIHASPRTTEEHYIIDDAEDLRPFVEDLESNFSDGRKIKEKVLAF